METVELISKVILAIVQIWPSIQPEISKLLDTLFSDGTITADEKVAIEAKLDADVARYRADVERRNAEEGGA